MIFANVSNDLEFAHSLLTHSVIWFYSLKYFQLVLSHTVIDCLVPNAIDHLILNQIPFDHFVLDHLQFDLAILYIFCTLTI